MYKLLIVEDETIIRRGIVKGIPWEEFGFQIAGEAANGKNALKLLEDMKQEELPDVAMVDIQMPVMNGLCLMDSMQFWGLGLLVETYTSS